MSNVILDTILPILLAAVVGAIGTVITTFAPNLFAWIKTKTNAIKLGSDQQLIKYAMDVVEDLVSKSCYVTQATADAMKAAAEDNKLTSDEIESLKNEVLKLVKDALPDISGKTINDVLGGPEKFEALVYTIIDSVIQSRKNKN